MSRLPAVFFAALFLFLFFSPAWAEPPGELRVATRQVAPFVMKKNGDFSGFSIDLWHAIAAQLKLKARWQEKQNVAGLLEAVKTGKADCAVAAISITAERDRQVDFSQPIYDSGLQIMVHGNATAPSLWDGLVQLVQSPLMGQFIFAAVLLSLLPAHLLWLVERRHQDGIIRHKSYFPGIFEAAWWTVSCLATQAEEMPKTVWTRILAVVWMFFAVIFIAYVTAALTANLTLQSLRGDIHSPSDLPGKRIATVAGSTSEEYLRGEKIAASAFPTVDGALEALQNGEVEAIVYDAPILLFHAANAGKGKVSVVGSVFRRESYGIAFPNGSKWRKPVNFALLSLRESGEYDQIREKWFGAGEN